MKRHFLIVGCGQLGSRHLQSLTPFSTHSYFDLFDPSETSLLKSKDIYVAANGNLQHLRMYQTIESIAATEYDLIIIATNANVRLEILTSLIYKGIISKNWILEKVLAQSVSEITSIQNLLSSEKAWVNCPRRMYEVYQDTKKRIKPNTPIDMKVVGTGWGLACNSVHYIDLLSYLSGSVPVSMDCSKLIKKLFPSKRVGNFEFMGELKLKFKDQSSIELLCEDGPASPAKILLNQGENQWEFREAEAAGTFTTSQTTQNFTFTTPFQSQLTKLVADAIFSNEKCKLTPLDDSALLHIPFISGLHDFYNIISETNSPRVPIT